VESDVKLAVTVLEFVQLLPGVLEPATKFTTAHWVGQHENTTPNLPEWRKPRGSTEPQGEVQTWYKTPSGALATTPITPLLPIHSLGTETEI